MAGVSQLETTLEAAQRGEGQQPVRGSCAWPHSTKQLLFCSKLQLLASCRSQHTAQTANSAGCHRQPCSNIYHMYFLL